MIEGGAVDGKSVLIVSFSLGEAAREPKDIAEAAAGVSLMNRLQGIVCLLERVNSFFIVRGRILRIAALKFDMSKGEGGISQAESRVL